MIAPAMLLAVALAGPLDRQYSIVTTTRLVQPYDVAAMNDEFQKAKLIEEKDGVGTFEITYYPFHQQDVGTNTHWRTEDASMTEYLKPRAAANWDKDLQDKILAELKEADIDPEILDDKTLVEKVSKWAIQRSKFNTQFGLWMVEFRDGKPAIAPSLTKSFWENEPKGMTPAQVFDREVFGKAMVENKTHGACTSTSTYMATILRAIGIPTRIVLTVPAFDANDSKQTVMMAAAIRHNITRRTILRGNSEQGFSNHVFNEVWVGHKWVRLNYDVLGQSILDHNYEGLMTHVYTTNDISEVPFAQTWGARYAGVSGPKLSSINPYQLVAAHDELEPGIVLQNPILAELTSATVIKITRKGDPSLPDWVQSLPETDAIIQIQEWLQDDDYHQLRTFLSQASQKFTLSALGHPDIEATVTGDKYSDGSGRFQAFGLHFESKPIAGVQYHLAPHNEDHPHTWSVAQGVAFQI